MPQAHTKIMPLELGITEKDRLTIVQGLSHLLADTYTLYLKTHNFHWNVTGPQFQTLHALFMQFYQEQWLAVDQIAERIRTLGAPAPGSYDEFSRLTAIKPGMPHPHATDMVRELVHAQQTLIQTARKFFPVAEQAHDQVTCDLLTQRLQIHEKNTWMLRSLLEDQD